MSKQPDAKQEREIHISKLSNAAAYLMLAHEDIDITHLPIDPSIMSFQTTELDLRFRKALYSNPSKPSKLSREYYYNILLFSWFFIGFALIKIVTSILLYSYGKTSRESLTYSVTFLILFGIALGIMIFLIKSVDMCRAVSFTLLASLGLCIGVYLLLGDERIFSQITEGTYYSDYINHLIPLIAFVVRLRYLLFNSFKHMMVIVLVLLMLHLGLFAGFSPQDSVVMIGEFLIVILFLALELLDSYQVDYRNKQLFYRKLLDIPEKALPVSPPPEKNEKYEKYEKPSSLIETNINPDLESVMQLVDEIRSSISSVSNMISYPDTKVILTDTLEKFDILKKSIAHLNVKTDIPKIEVQENIDYEDREFLYQNYAEPTPSVHSSVLRKPTFMMDMLDKRKSFPFRDYGLEELESLLGTVGKNWNFDIWFVYESTGHSVFIIGKYLLQTFKLGDVFNIPEVISDNFFKKIEAGYRNNPYHNACHAADVLHSMLFYILNSSIRKHMTDLDSISVIIAALAHDIQHGAVTNRFLVNSRDPLALKYNDISVLENMHAAQTFKILSDESANIFHNISPSDFFAARKLIIDLILGTDMTKHFSFLGNFRARVNISDLNLQKDEDKSTVLTITLKCADLGHSAKTLDLHRKWSELVCEEFFNQGDLEKSKNLPVSMYCDRDSTNVPKSQAGFIKNVCLPLFEVMTSYLNSEIVTGHCINNLKRNLEYWEKRTILRPSTMIYEPDIIAPPILKRKTQDVTRNKSLSTY